MEATLIISGLIIGYLIAFRIYKRRKTYKVPKYYDTPTNYAELDFNQYVRKRHIDPEIKKKATDKMIDNIRQSISELSLSDEIVSKNEIIGNNTDNWNDAIQKINHILDTDTNTGFADGFGGGEFSGGGAGESWSDDSNNSND